MTLYLVFQWVNGEPLFQGVFDTRERAVAACHGRTFCVCPAVLNEELALEREAQWPGAEYPLAFWWPSNDAIEAASENIKTAVSKAIGES